MNVHYISDIELMVLKLEIFGIIKCLKAIKFHVFTRHSIVTTCICKCARAPLLFIYLDVMGTNQ